MKKYRQNSHGMAILCILVSKMTVYSWNVNGLRSVHRSSFLGWLAQEKPDIVCLQEIKIQENQIPAEIASIKGYTQYYNTGTRKGYAGIAIYTKVKPKKVTALLGMDRFDSEGRFLRLDYDDFIVIGVYMPQGARDKRNMGYKLEVYDILIKYLKALKGKNVILVGDLNIAHTELDLARPKENTRNTMFTPEEREKIEDIRRLGYVDTFRMFNKEGGNYSWWPYFANARERNLGWRIDYILASKSFITHIKNAFITPTVKGSDHCPIGITIKK